MLVRITKILTLLFQVLAVLAIKRQRNQIKQSLFWIRYQVTGSISIVSYTSLTHSIESHTTLSAADAFQKIPKDKSEISFNHVYFNQTRSPQRNVPPTPPKQNQLYVYSGILLAPPLN